MVLIPKNPISMCGTLAECWLFAYRTPQAALTGVVPPPLELLTHNGWAFWNVVVCKVRAMRPVSLPEILGVTYWHVAYRVYVRFHTSTGKCIDGLYFVRSDCDNSVMSLAGNILTDFNFHVARMRTSDSPESTLIEVQSPDMPGSVRISHTDSARLQAGSCFASLEEAAQFLKYSPSGISIVPGGAASVVHIDRNEQQWQSRLMHVTEDKWSFFSDKPVSLEVCYRVQPIDYVWRRAELYAPRQS